MRARDNPLSAERVDRLHYHPAGASWDELLGRLAALDYRAAVVGPDGSGKTTLLADLEPAIRDLGLNVRLLPRFGILPKRGPIGPGSAQGRAEPGTAGEAAFELGRLGGLPARLGSGDVILLDGADHLGRWAWRRIKRRARGAGGLVVTSHRRGLLPTLIECSTSVELLDNILETLLGPPRFGILPKRGPIGPGSAQGRAEPGAAADVRGVAHDLFARHRGNIRAVLRDLYDLFAERPPGRGLQRSNFGFRSPASLTSRAGD